MRTDFHGLLIIDKPSRMGWLFAIAVITRTASIRGISFSALIKKTWEMQLQNDAFH